jgi:hypothetical protein
LALAASGSVTQIAAIEPSSSTLERHESDESSVVSSGLGSYPSDLNVDEMNPRKRGSLTEIFAAGRLGRLAAGTGSVRVKVVPRPGSD